MPDVYASSPFAELLIQPIGDSVGALFEHYQHRLTGKEEAVLGLRCLGLTYPEVAKALLTTQFHVKQLERQGIRHMIFLYQKGY